MSLKIVMTEKEHGVIMLSFTGSIDSDTCQDLDKSVAANVSASTKGLILDMEGVDFISSMGLGSVFRAKQMVEKNNGTIAIINLQPHIKRVFDAVKIIPQSLFASLEQADEYLDAFIANIAQKEKEGQGK